MDDLDSGTSTLPGEDDTLMENDDLRFVPIPDSRSIGQRDRDLSEVDRVHFFNFYSLLYLFTKKQQNNNHFSEGCTKLSLSPFFHRLK